MRAVLALLVAAAFAALALGSGKPESTNAAVGPARAGKTLTIYSSMPRRGPAGGLGKAVEGGARIALADAGGSVGSYRIRYRRLDSSLASTGAADEGRAARNASRAGRDATAVGYIGEYNSGISKVTIPILNRRSIAQVSPSNTYVGLTSRAPGAGRGEPRKYYPTGRRTYARVIPNDTVQASALAVAASEAGCGSIRVWDTGSRYSAGLRKTLLATARRIGLKVEGHNRIDPRARGYKKLARRIHSDCFVFTGEYEANGARAVRDAAGAPSVRSLFAGDGMCLGDVANRRRGLPAGVAARFRCTIAALSPGSYAPSSARILSEYADKHGTAGPDVLYGYESMALLLDAIRRADARGRVSRRSVAAQLFRTRDRESPLGTYSIDSNGDTSITDFGLYKIDSGRLAFDRVVHASR